MRRILARIAMVGMVAAFVAPPLAAHAAIDIWNKKRDSHAWRSELYWAKVTDWRTNGSGDPTHVYTEYKRASDVNKVIHLDNKSGRGTTAVSGKGSKIMTMKACADYYWSPDDCSGWVNG